MLNDALPVFQSQMWQRTVRCNWGRSETNGISARGFLTWLQSCSAQDHVADLDQSKGSQKTKEGMFWEMWPLRTWSHKETSLRWRRQNASCEFLLPISKGGSCNRISVNADGEERIVTYYLLTLNSEGHWKKKESGSGDLTQSSTFWFVGFWNPYTQLLWCIEAPGISHRLKGNNFSQTLDLI